MSNSRIRAQRKTANMVTKSVVTYQRQLQAYPLRHWRCLGAVGKICSNGAGTWGTGGSGHNLHLKVQLPTSQLAN